MRNIVLVGLACLAVGILGALGYSHCLGEGKQLAELQAELDASNAKLHKVTQASQQAKSETDAMSAQIQQLTSTKEDLTHQLDALKNAAPTALATSAPSTSPMAAVVKAQFAQMNEQKLLLLKSRLHLSPEQEAAVKAEMDDESKRTEEGATQMMSGGKVDPNEFKGMKTVDEILNHILTPDQKTAYTQMQSEEKTNSAETSATFDMNQMAPLLQLSDTQKDQVGSALMQVQLDTQDPTWIKNNVTTNSTNPLAILDAQAKAKEDALSKILTPEQLATYHQQAQSQLDAQKAMMQKFMPPTPAAPVAAPAPTPATGPSN